MRGMSLCDGTTIPRFVGVVRVLLLEIQTRTTRACRSRDGSTIPRFVGVVRVLLLEIQRL